VRTLIDNKASMTLGGPLYNRTDIGGETLKALILAGAGGDCLQLTDEYTRSVVKQSMEMMGLSSEMRKRLSKDIRRAQAMEFRGQVGKLMSLVGFASRQDGSERSPATNN